MIIEIWSDFVCPFCYIGKRKVEKAINKLPNKPNIKVIYKAFELNPEAPLNNSLRGSKAFAKMKGYSEAQSKQMFLDVAKKASEYGLKYDMENTIPVKTYKAHRLAKWARIYKKENALTELLMDAHFVKGLNIADDDISEVNIPTGIPLIYELEGDVIRERHYLASGEELARAVGEAARVR